MNCTDIILWNKKKKYNDNVRKEVCFTGKCEADLFCAAISARQKAD